MRLRASSLLLLLAGCTAPELKNVASTVTVGAAAYNGSVDAGHKRDFDSDGTQVFVSFRPFVNLEQPRQVIVVQPPDTKPK